MIVLKTQVHSFLNITIHQIKYKDKYHFSYKFAGIASYDITGDGTFKKISQYVIVMIIIEMHIPKIQ